MSYFNRVHYFLDRITRLTINPQQAWAAPPTTPTGLSPATGTTTTDQTPLFGWSRVGPATLYRIQIDDTADTFPSPEVDTTVPQPPGGAISFSPSTDLAEGTYFWHVRAENAEGVSVYTTAITIIINDIVAPGVPNLLLPSSGATINDNTPTFTWDAVSDSSPPVTYQLQVATDSTFSGTLKIDESSISSPTFTPGTAITPDGTYFWRVRASDSGGNTGSFSVNTRSFTIDSTGPTVTASPTTGTFGPAGTSVTLSSESGATIFYTTDGSTPDNTATEYTAPISITSTTTLKFIGYDTFGTPGTVGTETYTIGSATTDTSISLQLSGNNKVTAGAW
jgi:Fn3 associated/Bacterial Ig-like domain